MSKMYMKLEKSFKYTLILIALAFHGFVAQSLGSESNQYPLWKDDAPMKDALYMREIAPEFKGLSEICAYRLVKLVLWICVSKNGLEHKTLQ